LYSAEGGKFRQESEITTTTFSCHQARQSNEKLGEAKVSRSIKVLKNQRNHEILGIYLVIMADNSVAGNLVRASFGCIGHYNGAG
jgi:hypothetical protein